MSTKHAEKSIPWLLWAVTIVGCAYICAYVFPRLARYEAESSPAAMRAAAAPRPCLELTSNQNSAGDGYGRILGSVRNNCEKQFLYVEVEFKLYDSTGDVVGAALSNQAVLGPYQNWNFEAIAMQPYARYQLAHVAGD
jgi:hypothetical protein